MHDDLERCIRAVRAKDPRFDGWFFAAVITTGNYCRPSCPAMLAKVENMRFYPSAAAAQRAGFRACKRCRPDASPGSPQWNERADLVARAMRLIADGEVDRNGVPGLAAQLGYSVRQIQRQLLAELGAGPLALARAQRAQTARLLIETSSVPMADIAFAAGFASVRTFNDTVREVFGFTPTELRNRVEDEPGPATGSLLVRLPFRAPLCTGTLFGQLAQDAVAGVEEYRDKAYSRTLRLPYGHGVATLRPAEDHIECRLDLTDLRDLSTAIARCRWLLDLDADPVAVDEQLRGDPMLAPQVDQAPGRRVPRTVDPAEFAIRAVLGQGTSSATARIRAARFVAAHGKELAEPVGGLTRLFPEPSTVASLDPGELAVPKEVRGPLLRLANALAGGDVDVSSGSDWSRTRGQLASLPGIEAQTVEKIAMRALGDPDAFVPTQYGVQLASARLGLNSSPEALTAYAYGWRPWRAYATQYLQG
ncbi:AraC family transcriptional regulator of adaptative response / DNA-3-methyladenine glycosylase II [Kibdelosporangium banguiense]|uniref:DNA-3-methyladenine glycosylase II n=1 Tax=Kibdelosporangium banguiense TaxID=1365924 RepID=A0ABS4TS41_9PSEU|nr:AlkA N-terminal domain-containing protein [Kibdelosporangium banguiense]MBP2327231.1 AraC family transcriptional regulator of adaptative response / DNA-3-methyladenine glycosylase II [Kibdelosporangium banguiense]